MQGLLILANFCKCIIKRPHAFVVLYKPQTAHHAEFANFCKCAAAYHVGLPALLYQAAIFLGDVADGLE